MADVGLIGCADPAAQRVLRRYVDAFCSKQAVLVADTRRIDRLSVGGGLAGWHVTDCRTRYEKVRGTGGEHLDDIQFETSGTVGEPKRVHYRKSTIRACASAIATALDLTRDRDYLCVANPRFAYGLSVVHSHLIAGVPVCFHAAPVSLQQWAGLRRELTPNSSVYLAPHQSFLLAQDTSWHLDGPVELIFAGGALTDSMVEHLRRSFPDATITNMYGQAELGPRVSVGSVHIDEFRAGDVGWPLPGVEVRIRGDDPECSGMILVDSPFRMSGYLTGNEATPVDAASPGQRWWVTGDLGRLGPDGRLYLDGRSSDDVNFLGARVSLIEIRDVVRAVPGVLDVRVTAVEHEVFGQQPCVRALVRARDDQHELSVRRALSASMGNGAGAVRITIVDWASLPDSGKL